jgi:uncharacterized protein (TIGR02001 family)
VRAPPWLLAFIALPALANDRWGGSVALTSDYRLRGITQSDGVAAWQADVHYDSPSGWIAGLWASSVRLYGGSYESNETVELNAFLGRQWRLDSDWSARVVVSHYAHPWDSFSRNYDYDDVMLGTAWRDRLFLTATWSPNTSIVSSRGVAWDRSALNYDVTGRAPIAGRLSGFAGAGYYDLSELVGTGYWYGSAGVVYDLPWLHLEVSRVQTSAAAKRLFYGGIADNRWTATLMWTF